MRHRSGGLGEQTGAEGVINRFDFLRRLGKCQGSISIVVPNSHLGAGTVAGRGRGEGVAGALRLLQARPRSGGRSGGDGGGVGFPDRRCPNPLAMKMNQQQILVENSPGWCSVCRSLSGPRPSLGYLSKKWANRVSEKKLLRAVLVGGSSLQPNRRIPNREADFCKHQLGEYNREKYRTAMGGDCQGHGRPTPPLWIKWSPR